MEKQRNKQSVKSASWTGERLETFIVNANTAEHLHRYALALSQVSGKRVLDIASGEGYGSALLAKKAELVYGVDISEDAIVRAATKYTSENLHFKTGSCTAIPLDTHSVDVVVSFETLEHHDKHEEMLFEIKRVLKPGGVLIISSPDKKNYSDVPGYQNPFHIKELYAAEFKILLQGHFVYADFYLQKNVRGSMIIPEKSPSDFEEYTGDYEQIKQQEDFGGVYNVCIASDENLPVFPSSLFSGKNILEITVEETVDRITGSASYRLGHFLLSPIRIIAGWFR